MTTQQMVDLLGFRLEDTRASKFGIELRLDVLNESQLTAVNMLHNDLLTELQEVETSLSFQVATGGVDAYFALTGLTNEISRNGILQAKVSGTTGKYYNIIKFKDVKQVENTYLTGSEAYPVGYILKNRFYSRTASVVTFDLWYLKKPSALQYIYVTDSVTGGGVETSTNGYFIDVIESTLTSAENDFYNGAIRHNKTKDFYAIVYDYVGASRTLKVFYDQAEATEWEADDEFYFIKGPGSHEKLGDFQSELNDNLHEIIVDLAESTLFKMVSDMERSNKANEIAFAQINALNERAVAEEAAGIGTKAKGN